VESLYDNSSNQNLAAATGNAVGNNVPLPQSDQPILSDPPLIEQNVYDKNPSDYRKKSNLGKIIIVLVLFLLLLGTGGSALGAYLIAYEKIDIGNKDIQNKILFFVQDLPFAPKSPKYVIYKSTLNHSKISSTHINASVAVESGNLGGMLLGTNNFDASMEGSFDYKDKDNPQFEMNISMEKLLNSDFIYKDKISYIKINEIPPTIYPLLGLSAENMAGNPILKRWFYIEEKPVDTEARKYLEENKEESENQKIIESKLRAFGESKILPLMKTTEEKIDGEDFYKMTVEMEGEQLSEMTNELSDIISGYKTQRATAYTNSSDEMIDNSSGVFSLWIGKKDYYVKKGTIHYSMKLSDPNYFPVLGTSNTPLYADPLSTDTTNTVAEEVDIVISFDLSRHGEDFNIQKPDNAISYEDLMLELTSFMQKNSPFAGGYPMYPMTSDDMEGGIKTLPDSYNTDEYSGFR
jgi:hypothetical protein